MTEETNTRGTADASTSRIKKAASMLAQKVPPSHIVHHIANEYNLSLQTARTDVKAARALLSEAFDISDIRWLFISTMESLQEDRLNAQDAGNHAAQVGASKAMVHLLKQIPNIDPMGCWNSQVEAEFNSFVQDRLAPRTGKIPRQRISHNKLDSLDEFDIDHKWQINKEKMKKDIEAWKKRTPDVDPLTGERLEDDIPF